MPNDRDVMRRKQGGWSVEMMARAIEDIIVNKLSLREASAKYGIPHPSIRKHLIRGVASAPRLSRFRCALNADIENELVKYIIDMQQRFFD